jgi:ribosomal protein S12 methylthiotransferase
MKTYIVTMGCPKNLVDSEASIALLQGAGCTMVDDPSAADLLIVSACSFLDAAWQETVDEVERLAAVKQQYGDKKLVLMGCLPKHRKDDLPATLPDVDHFLSTGAHHRLPAIVGAWRRQDGIPDTTADIEGDRFAGFEDRVLLTPPHTAYVKIAEGCSRRCTFCAIPKIRGRMVSRPVRSIVNEIETLIDRGVKEVSLLAQDITSYNDDGKRLPDLVSAIADTGVDWIRIFYVHPGSLTLDLARRLFEHPAVCRYLEAPVQHASDQMLRGMKRPYTRKRLERLFSSLQTEFPDLRIRSEVIVGFPGETEDDFEELKDFIEQVRFASLGVFTYSPEQSTPAAALEPMVPNGVKSDRAAELGALQEAITFGLHCADEGTVRRVLVDREMDPTGDVTGFRYAGRYYGQALEVDGEIWLRGRDLTIGQFVDARITDSDTMDLRAEVV